MFISSISLAKVPKCLWLFSDKNQKINILNNDVKAMFLPSNIAIPGGKADLHFIFSRHFKSEGTRIIYFEITLRDLYGNLVYRDRQDLKKYGKVSHIESNYTFQVPKDLPTGDYILSIDYKYKNGKFIEFIGNPLTSVFPRNENYEQYKFTITENIDYVFQNIIQNSQNPNLRLNSTSMTTFE